MKEKLDKYVTDLLQERIDALFGEESYIQSLTITARKNEGQYGIESIILTLENKIISPTGAKLVVDVEKDIIWKSLRTKVEVDFTESLREVKSYLEAAFGSCVISQTRDTKSFNLHYL